ncbi:FAD-dependent oxidoreductase [Natronococcus pandeyae]|uniref:FAD-dependent oxidoreductase n=1 Tax=Natronococcus pandeyae TaxID=2055836 RepID=UPI0011E7B562|nr:FAD-dependent oxidoreductase [Natronococcus pandeyae]
MPPGVLSRYAAALRNPAGRLHWAGTKTATQWNGYVEGVVASAHRVVDEVVERHRE